MPCLFSFFFFFNDLSLTKCSILKMGIIKKLKFWIPCTSPTSWKRLAKWTMRFITWLNPPPILGWHLRSQIWPKKHTRSCWLVSFSIHDLRTNTSLFHSLFTPLDHYFTPSLLSSNIQHLIPHPHLSADGNCSVFLWNDMGKQQRPTHPGTHVQTTCICNHVRYSLFLLPWLNWLASYLTPTPLFKHQLSYPHQFHGHLSSGCSLSTASPVVSSIPHDNCQCPKRLYYLPT